MKIIIYLGHPAHFHLFKNVILNLTNEEHQVKILIKKKDVLKQLIESTGWNYQNILAEGRKDNKLGMFIGVLKRDLRLYKICRNFKPNLLVGTSIENSHISKFLGIPSISVNEDDADVVPLYAKITYPWASSILSPDVCNNLKWNAKTIKYSGYHELAYLHPNHFKPDKEIVRKYFLPNAPYFIIRFAKLKAHHDVGMKGIDINIAKSLIDILKSFGKIFITSERELENELESYRININPIDIHHVLAFAKIYIGDSQTMAAEAGVLGTPFIRFNDFVGKIGYLNELENKYKLGFGFKTDQKDLMNEKIKELLNTPNLKDEWDRRRQKMLSAKIDVSKFMTWFIENYPESVQIMKENPDYQYRFK
jgi:predicted glycosyltransferase